MLCRAEVSNIFVGEFSNVQSDAQENSRRCPITDVRLSCTSPTHPLFDHLRCTCDWRAHTRRLLESWVKDARRHGVEKHQIVTWVRRKLGGDVLVWRFTADGCLAVAIPCTLCSRELQRFDIRVHCSLGPDSWFSGRLNEAQAPPVGLTSGQRRRFDRPQPLTPQRQLGAVHAQPPRVPLVPCSKQGQPMPQVSESPSVQAPKTGKKAGSKGGRRKRSPGC